MPDVKEEPKQKAEPITLPQTTAPQQTKKADPQRPKEQAPQQPKSAKSLEDEFYFGDDQAPANSGKTTNGNNNKNNNSGNDDDGTDDEYYDLDGF